MIAEFGQMLMVLTLGLALILGTVPILGVYRQQVRWMAMARPGAYLISAILLAAFICLILCFVGNDFSVAYVANHSNSFLPVYFRIAATWGGHEGSLLLWITTLGVWMAAVARFSRQLPLTLISLVLSVMAWILVGFLLFTLMTSNPFDRLLPEFPLDGSDLNPLLQDIGLIIHPPLLYMGYVGFSVSFAFAIAGLLSGRLDAAWARWSRPWVTAAWSFLTIGIALGSWWAYYELGWGGWWFWDPVENASFMPWLTGIALMHSLAVTEKRGVFKAWTLLLAILAFSLSLLGTFLVRSGVLTSVHAFANDPERGLFILIFLAVVIGGSLLLFALRAHALQSSAQYQRLSREMALLANNILLMTATTVVLLGTLFPLIGEALGLGKISVGPPYFNALFVPLSGLVMLIMGVGNLLQWKQHAPMVLWQRIRLPLLLSVVFGLGLPLWWWGSDKVRVAIFTALSLWVLWLMLLDLWHKARGQSRFSWRKLAQLPLSYWGMLVAHLGMVVMAMGVAGTYYFSVERDVRLVVGQQLQLQDYLVTMEAVEQVDGANYTAFRGRFRVKQGDQTPFFLYPEKRHYWVARNVMTEAAIDAGIHRDVYIALGERLENSVWSVRVYIKPVVRLIWLGAILMAFGGVLAIADKRYRRVRSTPATTGVLA
jgi:cytochrome c-type biogenesis protein CcmF